MALSDITGSAIADQFLSRHGSYLGSDGTLMTWLAEHWHMNQLVWVVLFLGVIWLIWDWKSEGIKGIGLPFGLIVLSINFVTPSPFSIGITYFSLVVFTAFIFWRGKSLSKGGFAGMIFAMVGVSYLIFGNWLSLPIFGGIGAVMFWAVKHGIKTTEMGDSGERKLLKNAGMDVGPENKIIRKEHKAERKAHKEGDLGKVTEAEATVEERNVEEEIHAAALAAGVEEISKHLTEMNKASLTAEERDLKALDFARAVDKHMKEHAMESTDDATKAANIKADVKRLVMMLGEIAHDDAYADEYRKHSVKAIDETTQVMTKAAERARAILTSEIKEEKDVRTKANREIGKVRGQLTRKNNALNKLNSQVKNAKGDAKKAMEQQLGQLEQQRDMVSKSFSELDGVRGKIDDVLVKGRRVLKEMKNEADKLVGIEGELGGFSENMEKLEGHIGENIEKLQHAFKLFQDDVAGLDKDVLPEEIVLKATPHIGQIFGSAKQFVGETIALNQNDVLPFVTKSAELLKSSWRIEKAADFGNKVSKFVTQSLEQLAKMSAAANAGNKEEMKNAQDTMEIDQFQEKVSNYADWKANKIKAEVKKSYGDLGNAVQSVNAQIGFLQKEQGALEDTEKQTLDSLSTSMSELTKIRQKQFTQFQQAASAAQDNLAAAKKFEKKEKRAA